MLQIFTAFTTFSTTFNYKTFTQVVILGSASFVPFMQLPAHQRREVIEDILDIRIFSVMNSLLKDRMQTTKDEVIRIEGNHAQPVGGVCRKLALRMPIHHLAVVALRLGHPALIAIALAQAEQGLRHIRATGEGGKVFPE